MNYFIKITQTYSCKNKLDHAIFKALSDIDCLAIDTDDIHAYLRDLSAKIDGANEEHPRCTPRNLNIFSLYDQEGCGSIGCGVEGVLRFSVYIVKNELQNKKRAMYWYLKGFEDAETTEIQPVSHDQTMRDAETHFHLVWHSINQ